MKVLVTGGHGQLGTALALQESKHEIILCNREELNIEDRSSITQAMAFYRPDTVINCAAWTNVDGCEQASDKAFNVNGHAVGLLRETIEEFGSQLVQISTDYVFDGEKNSSYEETDSPNPLNVYGHSKLLGEQLAGDTSLTIRTSWVFSSTGQNILQTILGLLATNQELRFVNDQIGCPTYSQDLAATILKLISSEATGLFHITNSDPVSWYELAIQIAKLTDKKPERIIPITTEELDPPRPALRPRNSALNNKALALNGYHSLRSHKEVLIDVLEQR